MIGVRSVIAIGALILGAGGFGAQGQKSHAEREQRQFSAEDEAVKRPVTIPDEVMKILAKDERTGDELAEEGLTTEQLPQTWFSAAKVHLGGPIEEDLIVTSVGPLRGANIDPFWVFIHNSHGYRLVLTDFVHDLIVENTRSHGYRDLVTYSMTASTISTVRFRFDGSLYQEASSKLEDLK